ncbi:MAG: hypothetical protein HY815_07270, partial [Candidatus Riflebacteria bacterium]|nr:hypothetical protein [Candidatus Riflebacteria bacterium]
MNETNANAGVDVTVNDMTATAQDLLARTPGYDGARLLTVNHLCGDGSARRYFRLSLQEAPTPTLVLMLLSHEPGPVTAGGDRLNQDDTFVNLSTYFRGSSVPVPAVVCDARPEGSLLVEDVGDTALWHFAFDRPTSGTEAVRKVLGDDATL